MPLMTRISRLSPICKAGGRRAATSHLMTITSKLISHLEKSDEKIIELPYSSHISCTYKANLETELYFTLTPHIASKISTSDSFDPVSKHARRYAVQASLRSPTAQDAKKRTFIYVCLRKF